MRFDRRWVALAMIGGTLNACSGSSKAEPPTTYSVSGTITGLSTGTVVLQNNGGDEVSVSRDGTFVFATRLARGAPYGVTIRSAPASMTCSVEHGSGTVAASDVVDVAVTCSNVVGPPPVEPPPAQKYGVGGTISGVGSASGLVLSLAGEDVGIPVGATTYAFTTPLENGTYALSVHSPAGLSCVATHGGTVVVNGADVTDANVVCTTLAFTLGGTVAGLPDPGSITLADGVGHQVTVAANGAFAFPAQLDVGTSYRVTVLSAPDGRTCSVSNASGAIFDSNVADVTVGCSVSTFNIGGAVAGLTSGGLRITANVPGASAVNISAAASRWQVPVAVPSGTYQLTIDASPAGAFCAFAGGAATRSVTVAGADISDADIICETAVIQRWTAPTTWGGGAMTFWDDQDPSLVQHARFDASGNAVESRSVAWTYTGGTPPSPERLDAFPAGPRYGVGPFPVEGVNYQAIGADAALDAAGDMLACAVVKPDYDPVDDGDERPILSKGIGNATDYLQHGGWSLMQMHESICFHYELVDGAGQTRSAMAATPLFSANQNAHGYATNPPSTPTRDVAPLPSWVVVCGGRDGENLRVAVNGAADASSTTSLASYGPAPHVLDAAVGRPASIGGYTGALTEFPASSHVFRGRVYETAVWRVPATLENIQSRMAAAQGLVAGARYTRNRSALTFGADGELYATWRHAPRFDGQRGMLFGMQGWNRVSYWEAGTSDARERNPMVFAAGEDLSLWSASAGAIVGGRGAFSTPTGTGPNPQRITLPPGEALSIALGEALPNPNTTTAVTAPTPWWAAGLVHAQLWVLVADAQPSGAVLRVRKDFPDLRSDVTGGVVRDRYDINLSSLTPGTWTRVWLNGTRGGADVGGALSTDGTHAGTLFLENGGSTPISFEAWGVSVSQIANGGDLNSMSAVPVPFSQPSPDPGPLTYDWSASNDAADASDPTFVEDVLQLPKVPASTAGTGFCLAVDAQPADNLAWDARVHASRTPIAWADSADPTQVTRVLRLFVQGMDPPNPGNICFASRTLSVPGAWWSVQPEEIVACAPVPAGWAPGTRHQLKACATPAGALSIYADAAVHPAPIATGALANVPDLGTGRLLIGNGVNASSSFASPWHGYVARALACRATHVAACQ